MLSTLTSRFDNELWQIYDETNEVKDLFDEMYSQLGNYDDELMIYTCNP